jgi:acyl carrier protein
MTPPASTSPHETVAAFVRTRFRASLAGRELALDQPLLSSGIVDSFGVLELIAFLEDTFGVTIAASRLDMTELETVHCIVALVERLGGATSSR